MREEYYTLSPEETLRRLNTTRIGLPAEEADIRKRRSGMNRLPLVPGNCPARVRRLGKFLTIPSQDLVPGDIILIDAGSIIPADARVLELSNFKVDESLFSGEKLLVEKKSDAVPLDTPPFERPNMLFAGTRCVTGQALAVVTHTGKESEAGRIGAQGSLRRSEIFSGKGILYPAVARSLSGKGTTLACPATVATLADADVVCANTLELFTVSLYTVQRVYVDGLSLDVTGKGDVAEGEFVGPEGPFNVRPDVRVSVALRIAALCNDALLVDPASGTTAGDPVDGALVVAAAKAGMSKEKLEETFPRLAEIPYQREHQYMATLHRQGNKRVAYLKGAPEKVLSWCTYVQAGDGAALMSPERRDAISQAHSRMAEEGMRVCALAWVEYPVDFGRLKKELFKGKAVFAGLVGIQCPIDEKARKAVSSCRRAGVKVVMVTGDHPATASAYARELEIPHERVVVGVELNQMADEALDSCLEEVAVFARAEPAHVARIAQALRRKGHVPVVAGRGSDVIPGARGADLLTQGTFADVFAAMQACSLAQRRVVPLTITLYAVIAALAAFAWGAISRLAAGA